MADEKALTESILVVGGGISGLTTAVEAAEVVVCLDDSFWYSI